MLLERCTISVTVICSRGCVSWIGRPPTENEAVDSTVPGLTRPLSSAHAATNGFITEPGSNTSVNARLRAASPKSSCFSLVRIDGWKLG